MIRKDGRGQGDGGMSFVFNKIPKPVVEQFLRISDDFSVVCKVVNMR